MKILCNAHNEAFYGAKQTAVTAVNTAINALGIERRIFPGLVFLGTAGYMWTVHIFDITLPSY